jgi:hypothetical protein
MEINNDPQNRQTGKEEEYAYTITDVSFGEFKVLNTANGWWLDRRKVENLISAFKIDATDTEACVYAGIKKHQLDYFIELHPDFSEIREALKELPTLKARQTVVSKLGENFNNAMQYLKRKRRKEFGDSIDATTDGEKIQGNVIVFRDFSQRNDTNTPTDSGRE